MSKSCARRWGRIGRGGIAPRSPTRVVWLVSGPSLRRSESSRRSVHVISVVHKVSMERVFTQILQLSPVGIQGGSNMTGTSAACLHTNQSRSYLNHLVIPPMLRTQSFIYHRRSIILATDTIADRTAFLSFVLSLHARNLVTRSFTPQSDAITTFGWLRNTSDLTCVSTACF
jgi:hypothetical protein